MRDIEDIQKKLKKNREGFTLIELITTLAILSILIASVYNYFGFNLRAYGRSESLAQVQFDVRMAADYIRDEIRNVSEIDLLEINYLDENIDDNESMDGHSYINLDSLKSKYPFVESVKFNISINNDYHLLGYEVLGSDSKGQNEYFLETQVILNNITNSSVPLGVWRNTAIYKK